MSDGANKPERWPLPEFALIARFFAPIAGAGGLGLLDDAALFEPPPGTDLVLTKDMLVAGVHFFADDPADAIARKALRVNLSDLAAKGAVPAGFLLGLALPAGWQRDWLAAFAAGLADDARLSGCPLLGGDTVRASGALTLSITAFGTVPRGRMVRRLGARPGDRLYVSGSIGDAALGLRLRLAPDGSLARALALDQRAYLQDRYLLPRPRLALAPALQAHASAAMDISDGFAGDLDKMLAGAGCAADVAIDTVPFSPAVRRAIDADPALQPVALSGGDDYEILATVPPEAAAAFEAAAGVAGVPLSRLGTVTASGRELDRPPSQALRLLDGTGARIMLGRLSYTHQ